MASARRHTPVLGSASDSDVPGISLTRARLSPHRVSPYARQYPSALTRSFAAPSSFRAQPARVRVVWVSVAIQR